MTRIYMNLKNRLCEDEMNIYAFSESGASLAWDEAGGTIACAIARTMTRAGDGLNHQGGIAIVVNASTLVPRFIDAFHEK